MNDLLNNFHFLRPMWLLALPALVGIWGWIQRRARPGHELEGQIASHLLQHLVIPPKKSSFLTPTNLLLPIWIISVLSIAGPSWQRQPSPFADDRAQLMIILKVSESMMTDDLPPSRLEQARGKLTELLKSRSGAGTGLIAYSGSAHLVMPVTDDAEVIDHMLQSLEPSVMPIQGDALREAIALASKQLSESKSGGSIVVVADSVEQKTIADLVNLPSTAPPIQFFVPLRTDQALQSSGVIEAAKVLSSPIRVIAADSRDVDSLVARADRAIFATIDGDATAWRDGGYYLVPVLAILGLAWSRRGWSLGR